MCPVMLQGVSSSKKIGCCGRTTPPQSWQQVAPRTARVVPPASQALASPEASDKLKCAFTRVQLNRETCQIQTYCRPKHKMVATHVEPNCAKRCCGEANGARDRRDTLHRRSSGRVFWNSHFSHLWVLREKQASACFVCVVIEQNSASGLLFCVQHISQ